MAERKKNKLKIPVNNSNDSLMQDDSDVEQNEFKTARSKRKAPKAIEEDEVEEESESKKTNTSKENNKKERVKSKAPRVSQLEKIKKAYQQVLSFVKNERTHRIVGLLLLLSGAYLAVAFTSFLFTWAHDQDIVLAPADYFFNSSVQVNNWLGKLGAIVSHLFIHKWFGVASFLLVPYMILGGIKLLLNKEMAFLKKLPVQLVFYTVWTSVTLGFIFSSQHFYLGGGFGYVYSRYLNGILGGIGTGLALACTLFIFWVLVYNFSFARKTSKVNEVSDEDEKDLTEEEKPEVELVIPKNDEDFNWVKAAEEEPIEMEVKIVEDEKTEIVFEDKADVLEPEAEKKIEEEIQAVLNETNSNGGDVDFQIEQGKEETIIDSENLSQKLVEQFGEFDPTLDLSSYQFPNIDLLDKYNNGEARINQEELNTNKTRIQETLKNYGIEIEKIKATIGPTVTLYEINPAAGVRISKIKNLEDDIALSLSALGIRIIAPIPGKGTIGIEVPNQNPEMVPMRNILGSEKFQSSGFDLPIALGKTISNETFIADLAKMPHLLMAGATGQGKSVGLNAILVSLLYKKHPAQIKFVLVDPKKVELTLFNKIERHFLAKLPNSEESIITDTTKVVHTLNSLCIEMDNRYELLKDAQVRNIKEYNTKFVARKLNPNDGHKFLPYIVVVVDEFADLIMTAGKEVETPIARLAQLARAIGIHLIIATQRPSVNIITGTIKANFPARIAFRVTSKIDSRTILDAGGAEQLIGRGDMLLSTGNDLVRIQCAFVDTPEVEKITEFIGEQRGYSSAFLLPEYVDEKSEDSMEVDLSERDKMFDDAAKLVVQHQQGSASFLQRKLKLGYNRAGRIVDQLEAAGIIGPFEGSKAREVLVKDMMHLEEILNRLKGN